MNDYSNILVHTAEIDGKWIAATNAAPYFCFEAASEEAAFATAARALRFFFSVVTEHGNPLQEERVEADPAYHRGHTVSAKELACA
jgi:predicted RNase H-like HicB family nuclease